MTRSEKPWAVVVTVMVCALVTLGALVTAGVLRHERASTADPVATTTVPPTTSGVGADGCLTRPCVVVGPVPIGGTTVQLVADAGGRSGRVQIGGGGASDVIEVTITKLGAVLGPDSLQCSGGTQSACVVRGDTPDGMLGQIVVGRSGEWASLEKPFASDAGFVAVQDVTGRQSGPEVLVAQHRCDRPDCAGTPVYVQVFTLRSDSLGCTRDYARLDSIPDWPVVDLTEATLRDCG
ncbi:hypothetical protein [Actinophytocola glycyrrhizae]|uniref:Uncharacterized protein n=1 Tax=Actinophytocola glycyrrhizae TaxID=2044873 RepID=A0ABV9RXU6_9PSEU